MQLDFLMSNQQHNIDTSVFHLFIWLFLNRQILRENSLKYRLIITHNKMDVSRTQLIVSPRLKHQFDKYIRHVNIADVVLFAKTGIVKLRSDIQFDTKAMEVNPTNLHYALSKLVVFLS